ncbi:MAG TPA: hypothetical protein VNH18_05705 [Bryobacteraceae bacterium]|nr:hypothetical protein [Bryobacteraceae bacterium]
MKLGVDVGISEAATTAADAVKQVVPQVTDALEHAEGAVKDSLQLALAGIADGVSQIVALGLRADGSSVQVEGIDIAITIKNPKVTFSLGPYRP